ncbi:MAG: hypothetical protein JNL67_03320 [Planctomycetaceae bacterium]|nr:hypothetical protein [Planctomycetaceae bacterium]
MKSKLAVMLLGRIPGALRGSESVRLVWAWAYWLTVGLWLSSFSEPQESFAQAVPGAHYQVRMSDYYGQLKTGGYTPLRFNITRFGPAVNATETLYVGINVSDYSYNGSREVVSPVEFSAGQVSALVEMNVAFGTGHSNYAVITRDGSTSMVPRRGLIATTYLPDWLTGRSYGTIGNSVTESLGVAYFTSKMVVDTGVHLDVYSHPDWDNKPIVQTGPSIAAVVPTALPNIKQLTDACGNDAKRLLGANMVLPTVTDPQLTAALSGRFVVGGDFSAIPETWLGLSRVDICLMSVQDLTLLANQRPEKLEVIRQWVVAGGRLVMLDCQADYRALGSIVPNLMSAAKSTEQVGPTSWTMLEEDSATRMLRQYNQNASQWESDITAQNTQQPWQATTYDNPINLWVRSQALAKQTRTFDGPAAKVAEEAVAANAPCLSAVFGLGRIVAVPSDGTTLTKADWVKLQLLVFGDQEPTCYDGIGDSNHQFNGYLDFDYKRLGKPPWLLFLVMITLFSVLLGPVAFVILTRIGRTHLLLGAVPLIAGVITLGIVGYAMIQDGFAFRTSRLSVTWLDTSHQTALTQTTQMVYSGIAPGSLQVPRSTAYYDNSVDPRRYRYGQQRFLWQDDQQIISGTKVQARTKLQVTTFDAQAAPGQVLLSVSEDGTKWQATNELGFEIARLVIQTPVGPMMAESIGTGATVVLQNDSRAKSSWLDKFRNQERDAQAAIPELLRNTSYTQFDRLSLAARMMFDSDQVPAGMFLAISQEQPLARNLRENTFQDEELHLTIGRFRATTRLPDPGPTSEEDSGEEEPMDELGQESMEAAGDE